MYGMHDFLLLGVPSVVPVSPFRVQFFSVYGFSNIPMYFLSRKLVSLIQLLHTKLEGNAVLLGTYAVFS